MSVRIRMTMQSIARSIDMLVAAGLFTWDRAFSRDEVIRLARTFAHDAHHCETDRLLLGLYADWLEAMGSE